MKLTWSKGMTLPDFERLLKRQYCLQIKTAKVQGVGQSEEHPACGEIRVHIENPYIEEDIKSRCRLPPLFIKTNGKGKIVCEFFLLPEIDPESETEIMFPLIPDQTLVINKIEFGDGIKRSEKEIARHFIFGPGDGLQVVHRVPRVLEQAA